MSGEMSDEAQDLLVRGVTAARANSREEARFHLEWVLRTDASPEQLAEAWYWLSRITDDPAEKRRCLDMVLSTVTDYPEARRDLAILDGRLKPGELLDTRHALVPHAPASAVAAGDVEHSRCARCGSALLFDPATQQLRCQFCGYQAGAPVAPGMVAEQDWEAAVYTARGHRWELPVERVFTCASCGARQLLPPGHVSQTCPFCGAAQLLRATDDAPLIAPGGIAPFALDEVAARQHAHDWLAAQRFRPGDLASAAILTTPQPLYLSCWTFDLIGELPWQGMRLEREGWWENDGRRTERVSGAEPLGADDVLVPGSDTLPGEHIQGLQFDTSALTPYQPELLAGWPAELYRVPPAEASLQARERVLAQAREEVRTRYGSMLHDFTLGPARLRVVGYKLVLLPVWLLAYTYRGERHRLLVNGRTGAGAGDVPRGVLQQGLAWLTGQ
jgi:DNA-directed RNA polymerase subunit RPC12/RpoP